MYIDKVEVSYNDGENETTSADITLELLGEIFNSMNAHEVSTIVLRNTEKHMSLNIFYEDNKSFIGIINEYEEVFYYYDNGEKPCEHAEINGNYYDNRFISHDNKLTFDILKEFALTGDFYSEVEWIEE